MIFYPYGDTNVFSFDTPLIYSDGFYLIPCTVYNDLIPVAYTFRLVYAPGPSDFVHFFCGQHLISPVLDPCFYVWYDLCTHWSEIPQVAAEAKGLNPGLIVLLVIGGPLVVFLIANYVLYVYAQKNLPPKKKKPVSKKKLKREKLKQGVPVPGE